MKFRENNFISTSLSVESTIEMLNLCDIDAMNPTFWMVDSFDPVRMSFVGATGSIS